MSNAIHADNDSQSSLRPFDAATSDNIREQPPKPWMHYFRAEVMSLLLHKKFGLFGMLIGFYYTVQFVMCVSVCNFYSDVSRYYICQKGDQLIRGDDASAVYDTALYLVGIFHIIEWVRTTVLLVVVCVGVNLMKVWYYTAFSSIFGFICLVYVHIAVAGEDGQACSSAQETRYQWLVVEVVYFWTLFWIYQIPVVVFKFYSKEKLEEILNY